MRSTKPLPGSSSSSSSEAKEFVSSSSTRRDLDSRLTFWLPIPPSQDILHFVNVLSPPLNSTSRVLRSASRVDVRIERHVKIDPPAFHSEIQASVNRGTGGGTSGDGSEISMHTVESGKEGGEESAESQVDLVTLPTMGQTWDSR